MRKAKTETYKFTEREIIELLQDYVKRNFYNEKGLPTIKAQLNTNTVTKGHGMSEYDTTVVSATVTLER